MKTENGVTANHAEFNALRKAYDAAFRRYAVAVENGRDIAEAKQIVDEHRDRLVRFMIRMGQRRSFAVSRLAYSLWEHAGRPEGTAETDWKKAEVLLESHAA